MLATPSATSEGAGAPEAPPSTKITRGHSCVLCQQRKIKCDKQKPCSHCVKARVECVPSVFTGPRRRRRKLSEQDLAARLRRYEYLLKKNGVKIDEDEDHPEDQPEPGNSPLERRLTIDAPRDSEAKKGMLLIDRQNSRYVENTLWENLRDEIPSPKEGFQTSSEDEDNDTNSYPDAGLLLLSHGVASRSLAFTHPKPVHIFRLWQIFLVNVNPLVKIFHSPTVQQMILDASGDLENVPRVTEALMFAIYLIAVTSLNNEECEIMFGEPRVSLLSKYSNGAQQALINAKFLKSLNLYSLQAFAIFLLALRRAYDPHTLWVLTGTAIRIAQRLGIHRDEIDDQISPFDMELRKRTWWQVIFLDGQSSKLAGADYPGWLTKFDAKMPLNISDSDLSPGMKEIPSEKGGTTEMLFCSVRYEVVMALHKFREFGDAKAEGKGLGSSTGPKAMAERDKIIDELEVHFEQKYVRYCDASIPLHLLTIYLTKSVLCSMRLMAHHPRQYPDRGASMPQKDKDMVFSESLKAIEISAMGHSNKIVQGFQWHIHVHFHLDAFIYVLSELRQRTTGEQVSSAWQLVETTFEHRPEMLSKTKNSLYYAIGNLALKAWVKREEAGGLYQDPHQLMPPRFISILRSQRNILTPTAPQSEWRFDNPSANSNLIVDYTDSKGLEYNAYDMATQQWSNMDFGYEMATQDITSKDWEYWQTLMDGELPTYTSGYSGDWGLC